MMNTQEKDFYNPLWIYRLLFRAMLQTNREGRVSNSSTAHAIVLIEELLRFAKHSVDIYCRCLGPDVWCVDSVVSALQDVCNRGVSVRVVVQEAISADNQAVQLLRARGIVIKTDTLAQNLGKKPKYNFIVVDNKAFRFEQDCENRIGFACANDKEFSSDLVALFELVFSNGGEAVERKSK